MSAPSGLTRDAIWDACERILGETYTAEDAYMLRDAALASLSAQAGPIGYVSDADLERLRSDKWAACVELTAYPTAGTAGNNPLYTFPLAQAVAGPGWPHNRCPQCGTIHPLLADRPSSPGSVPEGLRPEVLALAHAMQFKLDKNAKKKGWPEQDENGDRGWKSCPPMFLEGKLVEEVHELEEALLGDDMQAILHEAADVANIAMMLADNAGALSAAPVSPPEEPKPVIESPAHAEMRSMLFHLRGVLGNFCILNSASDIGKAAEYADGEYKKLADYLNLNTAPPGPDAGMEICPTCGDEVFPFCSRGDCPNPDGRTTSEILAGKPTTGKGR